MEDGVAGRGDSQHFRRPRADVAGLKLVPVGSLDLVGNDAYGYSEIERALRVSSILDRSWADRNLLVGCDTNVGVLSGASADVPQALVRRRTSGSPLADVAD